MTKKVSLLDEFNKNKELTQENFKIFKDWFTQQNRFPSLPDELLALFLHSAYFETESAKRILKNYLNVRTEVPEVFCNRNPFKNDLVDGKPIMHYFMLSKNTPENYKVLFIKFNITDPNCLNFGDCMKSLTAHTDIDHYLNGSSPGWIIVQDLGGTRFGHIKTVDIHLAKKVLHYAQECIPIRLKGWHLINVKPIARVLFGILRPFIKKELYDVVHFHTNGLESLHEFVPQNILPSDYGGEDKSSTELAEDELRLLQLHEEYLRQDIKLLPDESKKDEKKSFLNLFS